MLLGRSRILLAAIIAILFGPPDSKAFERSLRPARGDACRSLPADQESSYWRCPGPAGLSFSYFDHVTLGGLAFGLAGREQALTDDLSWTPAQDGLGSRVEWHTKDGRPFAAIVARWRQIDGATVAQAVAELLVIKVSERGGCLVAALAALRRNAMADAGSMADRLAPSFRCGVDKPALEADDELFGMSSAKKLDASFAETETLDHNGSLVTLARSNQEQIEIRYTEPRKALQIDPGTVLFRGRISAGLIQGEAFVFKSGCAPAGYPVTGRRTDGILVLSGDAPHRGPGCEIADASKRSKHSTLIFSYEPLLNSHREIAAAGPATVSECSRCISASITSIEGVGTEHAFVEARISKPDIEHYCSDEGLDTTAAQLAECIRDNSTNLRKTLRAEANCAALTIKPVSGGSYKFLAMGEDYGGRAPTWTDLTSGKVECGARACNGAVATTDFTLLCPAAIPGWSGRHY
ncbi:hypothetical protein [Afipia sp. GAS231]|uniref:hypothetical protein n=1 Tax=Afipia sp. GAS231 TaxID=1882747 RepID=UPI00087C6CEB|nr:hypothetical protein [Afipia sp. GAS231]SDO20738.1 hypothetical protein SAMN05444050_3526 [Afipia sp. GAS231]